MHELKRSADERRFVRTEGFVKEQEAGRMLFKGAFSTGNPTGGVLRAWMCLTSIMLFCQSQKRITLMSH